MGDLEPSGSQTGSHCMRALDSIPTSFPSASPRLASLANPKHRFHCAASKVSISRKQKPAVVTAVVSELRAPEARQIESSTLPLTSSNLGHRTADLILALVYVIGNHHVCTYIIPQARQNYARQTQINTLAALSHILLRASIFERSWTAVAPVLPPLGAWATQW